MAAPADRELHPGDRSDADRFAGKRRHEQSGTVRRRARRRRVQPGGHTGQRHLGPAGRVLGDALGLSQRSRCQQRHRPRAADERQGLHRHHVVTAVEGAFRGPLHDQRLRQRSEPDRARRNVGRARHARRHARGRRLHRLQGFRRRERSRPHRPEAWRLHVLRCDGSRCATESDQPDRAAHQPAATGARGRCTSRRSAGWRWTRRRTRGSCSGS